MNMTHAMVGIAMAALLLGGCATAPTPTPTATSEAPVSHAASDSSKVVLDTVEAIGILLFF